MLYVVNYLRISYYILSCKLRYDYPDPGSEVDYVADNRVDYIKHYDGVAVAQFKKKVTTSKPFVRNVQNTPGKRLLLCVISTNMLVFKMSFIIVKFTKCCSRS